MPQHITDEVLHTFVTIGTYDTIARQLCDRFGSVATRCEFSIAVRTEADKERLRDLAMTIRSLPLDRVRKTIMGAVTS